MKKKPAISAEELQGTKLSDISAADFIEALIEHDKLDVIVNFPEKKKVELEVEPGILRDVRVGRLVDMLDRIKGEKKKREMEVPWMDIFENPFTSVLNKGNMLNEMNERLARLEKKIG